MGQRTDTPSAHENQKTQEVEWIGNGRRFSQQPSTHERVRTKEVA